MPQLTNFRRTKTITLPSWPDSQVEIYDSVTMGDIADVDMNEKNVVVNALRLLPKLIKSWNFTDEKGETLPITSETVGFFKAVDVKFLMDEVNAFSADNGKKEGSSQP